jgi:hypothetical protein
MTAVRRARGQRLGKRAVGASRRPAYPEGRRFLTARYNFRDTTILGLDLMRRDVSRSTGTLRLGLRALIGRRTFVELNVAHLSLGPKDFDTTEGRLFLSRGF